MKDKIKKILNVLVFLSGALLFVTLVGIEGFKNYANSIEDNYFVFIVGIDKATTEGKNVKITVLSEKFGEGGENAKKESDIITVEGETVFDAIREFDYFLDKKLFWGHLGYIIIGDEVAKEGILDYIDFFARDSGTRYDCVVAISKDMEAEKLLRTGEKKKEFIPDTLDSIFSNRIWLSVSQKIYLSDALKVFSNKQIDAYLPYLEVKDINNLDSSKKDSKNKEDDEKKEDKEKSKEESGNDKEEESEKNKKIYLEGLALFKEEKLIEYLDSDKSRAVNFVDNNIDTGVILIDDNTGEKLSLELIDNNVKIKPKLEENNELTVDVDISFTTNISEVISRQNVFYFSTLDEIEQKQSELIKKQIEELINITKENKIDIFNIDKRVALKYPLKWRSVENKKDIITNAKYNINVRSKLNRTYHLKESVRVKEEKK